MENPPRQSLSLASFNARRTDAYRKSEADEAFLSAMSAALLPIEREWYTDAQIEHPFVFVFGLPRGGTTLASQVLAHGLDVGYVSNIAARFWRAPVHGIRLSRIVLGGRRDSSFRSDYARTVEPADIHEFGYFWREWLCKQSLDDIVECRQREGSIDWDGLKRVLAAMQREMGRPIIAKNINGAYHINRLSEVLEQVIWVYVERDPVDAAISILDARRKYYGDPSVWWSYAPPDYDRLKNLRWDRQIAGQVHYLRRFYEEQIGQAERPNVIRLSFADLCAWPRRLPERVAELARRLHGSDIQVTAARLPESFRSRSYEGREEDHERFTRLLQDLEDSERQAAR
jgi:Sulfotransferase family